MKAGARPRILVVDDIPLFREVEALYLSRLGDVRAVASAGAARESLARERFDVAIVDLHLPDEPGDALCRSVLAGSERAPHFVLITRGEAGDHARAVAAGATDVLAKPLSRSELVGSVGRMLADDLRGLPRAAVREPAHLWTKGRISTGTVQNVSRGGAFVSAGWLPRAGAEIVMEFALPGEQRPIATPARVMWRRDDANPTGFGVRFLALDGATQRSLAKYIDEHAPFESSPAAS